MMRAWCLMALGWSAAVALAAPAASASAPPLAASEGPAACQKAAQGALRDTRGAVEEVSFPGPPSVQAGTSDKDEYSYKGAGRYRVKPGAARAFTYSCRYNTSTGVVAGVVLRDEPVSGAVATPSAGPARTIEPDLSHVSPEACESAAAAALQRRHPKVERISFDSALRQLKQSSSDRSSLQGQGDAVRVPGEPTTHFSYQCEFDPRNGRVIAVTATD
jgi:hypothetical protein